MRRGEREMEDIRAIGPGEDVGEAPGSDLGFGFFAGGRRHCIYRISKKADVLRFLVAG